MQNTPVVTSVKSSADALKMVLQFQLPLQVIGLF